MVGGRRFLDRRLFLIPGIAVCLLLLASLTGPPINHGRSETADRVTASALTQLTASSINRPSLRYPNRVRVRQKIVVRGSLPPLVNRNGKRKRRPVQLVERNRKAGPKWKRLRKKRAKKNGRFRFRLKAGKKQRVRVFRVKARGLKATRLRIRVVRAGKKTVPAPRNRSTASAPTIGVPAPAPGEFVMKFSGLGDPNDWEYLFNDRLANVPSRWDACSGPISWDFYPGRGYPGSLADVQVAFNNVSRATGLRFVYRGESRTPFSPTHSRDHFRTGVDIKVGWTNSGSITEFRAHPDALGLANAAGEETRRRGYREVEITAAVIAFNEDRVFDLLPGFRVGDYPAWGQVFVHEIMHALGLGHAWGPQQLMYYTITHDNHSWGAGDATGLTRIGAEMPCFR